MQRALVPLVGLGEAEEHQEQAEEGHRVVRQQHHAGQQREMHQHHRQRHRRVGAGIARGVRPACRCLRSTKVATVALITTATAAFQPKWRT